MKRIEIKNLLTYLFWKKNNFRLGTGKKLDTRRLSKEYLGSRVITSYRLQGLHNNKRWAIQISFNRKSTMPCLVKRDSCLTRIECFPQISKFQASQIMISFPTASVSDAKVSKNSADLKKLRENMFFRFHDLLIYIEFRNDLFSFYWESWKESSLEGNVRQVNISNMVLLAGIYVRFISRRRTKLIFYDVTAGG